MTAALVDFPVRPNAPTLRLTARGKVVVLAAALIVVSLLTVWFGSAVVATSEAGVAEYSTVEVMPGDTLWSIAAEANPGGDIRSTIDDITKLNSLENGSHLAIGAELAVPIYGG